MSISVLNRMSGIISAGSSIHLVSLSVFTALHMDGGECVWTNNVREREGEKGRESIRNRDGEREREREVGCVERLQRPVEEAEEVEEVEEVEEAAVAGRGASVSAYS